MTTAPKGKTRSCRTSRASSEKLPDPDMDDGKLRCQSCGMPLDPGYFGTNADGSQNREWCFLCFKRGAFTQPEVTLEEMVERSIGHMTRHLGFNSERAKAVSHEIIPNLKRWQ